MDGEFEVHRAPGAEVAAVAFGSYTNANQTAPSYGFMNACRRARSTSEIPFDAWYFVSERNDWYHRGARGLGKTLEGAAAELRKHLAGYRRRIFVGNSMGGYGALLFGAMVPADAVIDIAPQTRLDADFLSKIGETRWSGALRKLNQDFPGRTIDLHRHLMDGEVITDATVYVGADCPQDLAQAKNLSGVPGLRIVPEPGQGHDLAHAFRESGRLQSIILEEVGRED